MTAPLFDLDGLGPRSAVPANIGGVAEYDLTGHIQPFRAPDYDLPPIDMRMAWDLDILLQKEPVPEAEYAAWLRDLAALTAESRRRDATLHGGLAPLLEVHQAKFSTVAFGGHFKTGKSTLLNAALGRRVLPAADLPETGAICSLRSGDVDAVEVCVGSERRAIPCTLEAIQREISLIGEAGERRAEVHRVEQLEITLSGCGIPPEARWIDSPGINDTEEMNACALRAARQADVLVWVLSSKQPLSEVEMVFLAGYIAERGPTGVVFVLNAFLAENTHAAWTAFLARKAPWIQDKVLHHAPDLGFTPDAPPLIAPVSGLGLFGDSENDFGRSELRSLLLGLGSPEVPRIRRARLDRAALSLRSLTDEMDEQRERERTAQEARENAEAETRREAMRLRGEFDREARQAVAAFYGQWTANARGGADSLATTITGDRLERGDRYSHMLSEMLRNILLMAANSLVNDIRRLTTVYAQPAISPADEEALRRLVAPGAVDISVANLPGNDIASQTAARVEARLRSLMQPLGIPANPTLGAQLASLSQKIPGINRNTPEKRERDASQTRQSVKEAVEQAILSIERRREEVCMRILRTDAITENIEDEQVALPAPPALTCWDEHRETVQRLAVQAERLAKQDRFEGARL